MIPNNNRVCAGRTLAEGIVYQEIKANPDNVELQLDYEKIKKSDQPLQKNQALELYVVIMQAWPQGQQT